MLSLFSRPIRLLPLAANKAGQKSPELRESLWMQIAKRYGIDGAEAGGPPTGR